MKNLNAKAERLMDELMDSNNKESVNFVSGRSEFTETDQLFIDCGLDPEVVERSIKESRTVSTNSSDILDELLAESNSDSEEDSFDEDDGAGFYGYNEMMNSSIENGKSHLDYYPPRGFKLCEKSRATVEIIPVAGTEYEAETSPSGIQNENVVEGRTEESESVVQNQQPAPPVYSEQKVQKSKNPFAVVKSASDESATQPVQQPNSTETTIGAGDTGSENETACKSTSTYVRKSMTPNLKANDYVREFVMCRCELFVDQYGNAFATIPKGDYFIDVPVHDEQFKFYIKNATYRACDKFPNKTSLQDAIDDAEGFAQMEGKVRHVHVRFFHDPVENIAVFDLCQNNDLVVEVRNGTWNIIRKGEYKFFRENSVMLPLPTPIKGGNFFDIFEVLPFKRQDHKILWASWIITAPLTQTQRPLLMMLGEQRSGKTFAAKYLKRIIDPVNHGGLALNKKVDDLCLTLEQYAIPFFDNLSFVNQEVSNVFCQAVSDGAWVKRMHHKNKKLVVTRFQKPMIVTSIPCPYETSDLLDRTLLMEFVPLPDEEQKDGDDIKKEFLDLHPSILGGYFDLFAKTLEQVKHVDIKPKHRLKKWAKYCVAFADVANEEDIDRDEFLKALAGSNQLVATVEFGGNDFVDNLVKFLEEIKDPQLETYSGLGDKIYTDFIAWAIKNNVRIDKTGYGSNSSFSRSVDSNKDFLKKRGWSTYTKGSAKGTIRFFSK